MKSVKKLIVFYTILLCIISCKKIQPNLSDGKKGCDCAKEVSADFLMGEMYGNQFIQLDTIAMPINYSNGNPQNFDYTNTVQVYFSAKNKKADSYEWQVGNNLISQTESDFSLYFDDTIGSISVRLIVRSKPNSICFPSDDGVDTIIKTLTIKNKSPHPIVGKYYGYNTNDPLNTFTIEIDTASISTPTNLGSPYSCGFFVKNLPNGNNSLMSIAGKLGSTTNSFYISGNEYQPYNSNIIIQEGTHGNFEQSSHGIVYPKENKIVIDYYSSPVINQFTLGSPYPKRRFIGKKI